MKAREFHYDVTASFTVMADTEAEAEEKSASVRQRLEWTLNNVEVELKDHNEVEKLESNS